MANWKKIRTEYVTGDISYRKLAKKHKLSESALTERAVSEHWFQERKEYRSKTIAKSIDKISDREADKMARIDGIADALIDKLEKAVGELDKQILSFRDEVVTEDGKRITEFSEVSSASGPIDQKALRNLAASLKDLKEIKGLQTELQRQEQEARIANLRRQAEADIDKTSGVIVELEGGAEDYAG